MPRRPFLLCAGLMLLAAACLVVARLIGSGGAIHTAQVGLNPGAMAVDAATGHAFVANTGDDTVTMLASSDGEILRTIRVGYYPRSVTVDARLGRAFVLSGSTSTVTELDTATGTVLHTIAVANSIALAVDGASGRLLVVATGQTSDDPGSLAIVDALHGVVIHAVPVGASPNAVVVDSRTHRAFVANEMDKTVSVLDTISGRSVSTLLVGAPPEAEAIDARTGRLLVTDAFGGVTVFDTRTGGIMGSTTVGITPMAIAIDDRAGRAFVVSDEDETISMLDAWTGQILRIIPVAAPGPQVAGSALSLDIAVDQQRSRVFVLLNGQVIQVNSRTGASLSLRGTGHSPVSLAADPVTATLLVTNQLPEPTQDRWHWLPECLRRWLPEPPVTNSGSIILLREG